MENNDNWKEKFNGIWFDGIYTIDRDNIKDKFLPCTNKIKDFIESLLAEKDREHREEEKVKQTRTLVGCTHCGRGYPIRYMFLTEDDDPYCVGCIQWLFDQCEQSHKKGVKGIKR